MTRRYPSYCDSGVEWLGELPVHWRTMPLRWLASYRTSSVDKKSKGGEIPVRLCNYTDVYYSEQIRADDGEFMAATATAHEIARFGLRRGDVLITKDSEDWRDIGVPALVEVTSDDFVSGYHLGIVRPDDEVDAGYLFCALLSDGVNKQLQVSATGVTRYGIPNGAVEGAVLPYPPLDEQRSIAAFLNRETGRIDELISKQELLIERLDEYRAALVTSTVTRGLPPEAAKAAGLDPVPPLKDSGVGWLGSVPSHWFIARLKWSTAFWINGVWGEEADGTDDLLCVRVADFDRRSSRVSLDAPTYRQISRSQREGRLLQPGDLLLEKSGGGIKQLVGSVVRYEHDLPAVCSNFVGRVVLAEDADPAFWIYVHKALYAGRLNYPAIKQTTGIQNLDASAYFDLPVAYPPFEEQQAIAEYLDAQSARVDALRAKAEDSMERLQEYRLALVSAAVTGKIDVRESTADGAGGGA